MVASTKPLAARFAPPPAAFLAGRMLVPRFTRDDAAALVRAGVIPEDASTELLDGLVALVDRSARDQDPSMIGQEHRKCVERLSSLRKTIDDDRRHVESQQPLVCDETNVPQPDFVVLRGTLEQYTDLPPAADAFCVIEVADSSYERDAGPKLATYARAGVSYYVIINLPNRTAELYSQPNPATGTYPPPRILNEGDALPIRVGADDLIDVAMTQILP